MASTSLNKVSAAGVGAVVDAEVAGAGAEVAGVGDAVGAEVAEVRDEAGLFIPFFMSIPKKDFKLPLEGSNSVMLQIQNEIIINLITSLEGTHFYNHS